MNYSLERETALSAAIHAAHLCVTVQRALVADDTLSKDDKSPVTIADFGAQAIVCQHLRAAFPDDVIVGEEDSSELRQKPETLAKVARYVQSQFPEASAEEICQWIDYGNGKVQPERFWTLDPIDGTKGFLRNDQYAVALALIENGDPKVAVLVCPSLPLDLDVEQSLTGSVFVAVRGQGAQMTALQGGEFRTIQVTESNDAKGFRAVESVEHGDHSTQQKIAASTGMHSDALKIDSQAKYGIVARGDAALYLRLPSPKHPDYRENIWDHAAGALIVEEAGGQVSDMHGKPLDYASDFKMRDNVGVVVSSRVLHSKVIDALQQG